MKKVAFVCPWYGDNIPGGAEAALRGVSDHLFMDGVQIEILTTTVEKFASDWNKEFYKAGDYKSKLGIPIKRFKIRKRNVAAFDAVNKKLIDGIRLNDAEEETFLKEMVNSPDLYDYIKNNSSEYTAFIHIPYMFGTTYYGSLACPEKTVLIPCFHDEAYVYMKRFINAYSNVYGMLFNARPEYELTKSIYDLTNVKYQVMGLGLDTEFTYDADRFRKKFGINSPFILYAGRKEVGKNIYTLLKYFQRMKENPAFATDVENVTDNSSENGVNKTSGDVSINNAANRADVKDLKLVLIGGGEVEIPESIKADVYDLGFVDIQDKYDAYGAATLLCQPSKEESFSFVIMESWLANRPVLVHEECPVTKNFAIETNGGLYFKTYYEFEKTVRYILDNPEDADAMGKNGCEYVKTNFAWDIIVDRYKKYLEEMELANES